MKTNTTIRGTLAAALVLGTFALHAEPGNFGVNGISAWSSIEQKRVQHTDAFGDTYYTYSAEKPATFLEREVHQHKKNAMAAPQKVVDAFNKTLRAISLLHESDTKAAIKVLQKANTQLQTVLKQQPKLHQALVSQEITVAEYFGDSAQIEKSVTLAEKLLKEHNTQSARAVLIRLQDALIVENASLLVNAFAHNVNKTLVLLEQGELLQKDERDAALLLLNMALNDRVYERIIVPLPFLKAQHFVTTASALDTSKQDAINAYLDEAKEELKRAVWLGYIKDDSSEYVALEEEIQTIQKTLKNHKNNQTLYERIKKGFEDLLNRTRHKIIQSNAEAKVNTYERKEDEAAFGKKTIFKNEAVNDEAKTLGTTP